jgi:hypothetical protein
VALIGARVWVRLMVGHRPLQVAESRFDPGPHNKPENEISGTALVAAAAAPITNPGIEPRSE